MQLNLKMQVFGKSFFPTNQNLSIKMANQEMHIPRPQHECLCQLSVLRLQLLYCVPIIPHVLVYSTKVHATYTQGCIFLHNSED